MEDLSDEISKKFNEVKKKIGNRKDLGPHDFEILLLAAILEETQDESIF